MSEENKALIRHYMEECYNQKNIDAADACFSSDFVNHRGEATSGFEALKQNLTRFHKTFPDLHIRIDDAIAEGDQVVVRVTLSGTHRGVFMDVAPTGRRAVWAGVDIFRIAEGKIAERWVAVDILGLLLQLGAEVK